MGLAADPPRGILVIRKLIWEKGLRRRLILESSQGRSQPGFRLAL